MHELRKHIQKSNECCEDLRRSIKITQRRLLNNEVTNALSWKKEKHSIWRIKHVRK